MFSLRKRRIDNMSESRVERKATGGGSFEASHIRYAKSVRAQLDLCPHAGYYTQQHNTLSVGGGIKH